MEKTRLILVIALTVFAPLAAHSEERGVDTQFIFGFTAGADVGERGEEEIEHESIARLGKRAGSHAALVDRLRLEFTPIENFRFEIGVPVAFHNIAGVTGLRDRHQAAFDGVLAEFRFRLLDREHASFALTATSPPPQAAGRPVEQELLSS
jgi:hypothetical protein